MVLCGEFEGEGETAFIDQRAVAAGKKTVRQQIRFACLLLSFWVYSYRNIDSSYLHDTILPERRMRLLRQPCWGCSIQTDTLTRHDHETLRLVHAASNQE